MDLPSNKEEDIVIVGGGICGLATALALHRFKTIIPLFISTKYTHCVVSLAHACFFFNDLSGGGVGKGYMYGWGAPQISDQRI